MSTVFMSETAYPASFRGMADNQCNATHFHVLPSVKRVLRGPCLLVRLSKYWSGHAGR